MKKCRGFVSENGRLERHQYCPLEPHGGGGTAYQGALATKRSTWWPTGEIEECLLSWKWGNEMNEQLIESCIKRILERAKEASIESKKDRSDLFSSGRNLAYFEVLDMLRNELEANGYDVESLGMDIDIDELV